MYSAPWRYNMNYSSSYCTQSLASINSNKIFDKKICWGRVAALSLLIGTEVDIGKVVLEIVISIASRPFTWYNRKPSPGLCIIDA